MGMRVCDNGFQPLVVVVGKIRIKTLGGKHRVIAAFRDEVKDLQQGEQSAAGRLFREAFHHAGYLPAGSAFQLNALPGERQELRQLPHFRQGCQSSAREVLLKKGYHCFPRASFLLTDKSIFMTERVGEVGADQNDVAAAEGTDIIAYEPGACAFFDV